MQVVPLNMTISNLFDTTGSVRCPPFGYFLHELRSVLVDSPDRLEQSPPVGDEQIVLVIPGFLTGDALTRPLRQFLDAHGFRSFGWDYGVNFGPTPGAMRHLRDRVQSLYAANHGRIALVGVSLGGVMARYLALDFPDRVRHVATLASPFRLPTASTLEMLVRMCEPHYDAEIDLERLAHPLPVPSTAFFTRDDGVVAWESCRSADADCLNIEVSGPHVAICRNAAVLDHLLRRLAPPAD